MSLSACSGVSCVRPMMEDTERRRRARMSSASSAACGLQGRRLETEGLQGGGVKRQGCMPNVRGVGLEQAPSAPTPKQTPHRCAWGRLYEARSGHMCTPDAQRVGLMGTPAADKDSTHTQANSLTHTCPCPRRTPSGVSATGGATARMASYMGLPLPLRITETPVTCDSTQGWAWAWHGCQTGRDTPHNVAGSTMRPPRPV